MYCNVLQCTALYCCSNNSIPCFAVHILSHSESSDISGIWQIPSPPLQQPYAQAARQAGTCFVHGWGGSLLCSICADSVSPIVCAYSLNGVVLDAYVPFR
mmetsp:Transcript_26432/g.43290  ORF Transcript_26432/g.43290 Transcript_26432/m.43290 type:complete len:100 (+) Transcript_26432:51-350(+)